MMRYPAEFSTGDTTFLINDYVLVVARVPAVPHPGYTALQTLMFGHLVHVNTARMHLVYKHKHNESSSYSSSCS
jgi:hypothetical protein